MRKVNQLLISLIFIVILIAQCDNETDSSSDNGIPIKVIGTYLESVHKELWGDFQLILELEKSHYPLNEPIIIKLNLKNIGHKTIVLDGILPYRQSANPPYIDVCMNNELHLRVEKIMENLLNEDDIVIEPNNKVTLMYFDSTSIEGLILYQDTTEGRLIGEETDNIGTELVECQYHINASFGPTPQVYWSMTDTLEVYIE